MYRLGVRIGGIEQKKSNTGLLHLAAAFLLIVDGSTYINVAGFNKPLLLPIFCVAVISLGYGFFRKKRDPAARYNTAIRVLQFISLVLLAILLLHTGKDAAAILLFIFAGLSLALLFTERGIFGEANLLIEKEGIFMPGYVTKNCLLWASIDHVVIRKDYITIFKKDQKFLQFELEKVVVDAELQQITDFCRIQVEQKNITKQTAAPH
jgi:hypothetical protein